MNFQDLLHVEKYDFYIDLAFRKAKERAETARDKVFRERIEKSRFVECMRVQTVGGTIEKHMEKILLAFPNVDDLPEFYLELIKTTIDYPLLKKSLGGVNWAVNKTKNFTATYTKLIAKCKEMPKINVYRRQYYGRMNSVMKQIKEPLIFLEQSRKIMKGFPTIKTSVFTVSIAGFPNVGKTTLLYKLTGSKPEINEYAFTTRRINVAYMKSGDEKIQFLDTPGTLNRLDKMNPIEKQAYLAMKLCSGLIVYVFDLTLTYPMKDQKKLYQKLNEFGIPIIIYLSKSDLVPKAELIEFSKNFKRCYFDLNELKENISKENK